MADVAPVESEMPTGHPNSGGQVRSCTCKSGVQGRGLSRDRRLGAISTEMYVKLWIRLFLEMRADGKTEPSPGFPANKKSEG